MIYMINVFRVKTWRMLIEPRCEAESLHGGNQDQSALTTPIRTHAPLHHGGKQSPGAPRHWHRSLNFWLNRRWQNAYFLRATGVETCTLFKSPPDENVVSNTPRNNAAALRPVLPCLYGKPLVNLSKYFISFTAAPSLDTPQVWL